MRTLERLGLAEPAGPARWVLAADAERRLRELGERGDIIKRLHKSLTRTAPHATHRPGRSRANATASRNRPPHRPRAG